MKKAARDSYRLDKCLYEPLNVSIASSFNCIQTYQKEIKQIDQAIEKCICGMNPNAFTILKSMPGIGPVWAAGILSEIGDISAFHSSDALAKYAGLVWLKNDSGDFVSEDNRISKELEIRIFDITLVKLQTAFADMFQNTGTSIPKNTLK